VENEREEGGHWEVHELTQKMMEGSRETGELEDGRNPRRSTAAGEDVGDDCVAYRTSRLDLLAQGEPGRRGATSECIGAVRGGLEQRRDGR
jgi:hypothetical protein